MRWSRLVRTLILVCSLVLFISCEKEDYAESIGLKFRLIEPGTFVRNGEEISIEKSFHIGVYEVTQEQWEKVMGPSNLEHWQSIGNSPLVVDAPTVPARALLIKEVVTFCSKLSEKDGVAYRLPTRDEWEYACRAGTTTKHWWGDEFDGEYAWCSENSGGLVKPVGLKKANPWGLYDMNGGVEEIVDEPPGSAPARMVHTCGGSFMNQPEHCASESRYRYRGLEVFQSVGFRLAHD